MITGAQNFFPTPIFQHDIPGFSEENAKLLAYAKRLQAEDPKGVLKSNSGGWHSSSSTDLRDVPELGEVKKVIMSAAKHVIDGTGFDTLNMGLASAWFVVSPAGSSNIRHHHPRAFLSGVYYVQAPKGSSPLRFYDPRPAKVFSHPHGTFKSTLYTAETVLYEVQESRLILFPGWLEHSVDAHKAEGERVVLSFNFIAL